MTIPAFDKTKCAKQTQINIENWRLGCEIHFTSSRAFQNEMPRTAASAATATATATAASASYLDRMIAPAMPFYRTNQRNCLVKFCTEAAWPVWRHAAVVSNTNY